MSAQPLIQKALVIARKRAEDLERLKRALEQGEDREALAIARELCGLEPEKDKNDERPETSRRINPRVH